MVAATGTQRKDNSESRCESVSYGTWYELNRPLEPIIQDSPVVGGAWHLVRLLAGWQAFVVLKRADWREARKAGQ